MNTRERHLLLQTCYAHFMTHFNMLVFPALVLPLAAQFRLEMAQIVGMSFWMYLLFGISALLWGTLADRLGARPLMLLFYGGSAGAACLAALLYPDPVLLPLALAGGGAYRTLSVSSHTRTNIEVVRRFLPLEISATQTGPDDWRVELESR